MKNRILSVLAAFAVLASFSACQAGYTEQTAPLTTQSSEETNSTEIQYVTDWSIDELVQNIELNGKTYSMPFTLEDLGEEYSLGEKVSLSGDSYGYDLYYNDKNYALITLDKKNTTIISLTFTDNMDFKIGEFYPGNSSKDIVDTYGNPSVKASNNAMTYLFTDGNSISAFYENNKLNSISINYCIEEEEKWVKSPTQNKFQFNPWPFPPKVVYYNMSNIIFLR